MTCTQELIDYFSSSHNDNNKRKNQRRRSEWVLEEKEESVKETLRDGLATERVAEAMIAYNPQQHSSSGKCEFKIPSWRLDNMERMRLSIASRSTYGCG